jgi:hypothetical protein
MPELYQLFCLIRKKWVAATPEEKIRQNLIASLTQNLGYPLGHLALELCLSQMPHLSHLPTNKIPYRRTDLVVFAPNLHPLFALYPLLLIECKAVPLTSKTIRQTIGYNQYLQAYFIALVNQTESQMGWYHAEQKEFCFTNGLLSYTDLLKKSQTLNTY